MRHLKIKKTIEHKKLYNDINDKFYESDIEKTDHSSENERPKAPPPPAEIEENIEN